MCAPPTGYNDVSNKQHSLRAILHASATRLEVIFEDLNANNAAWLSEHMAIDASLSISSVLAQAQIAYTSA